MYVLLVILQRVSLKYTQKITSTQDTYLTLLDNNFNYLTHNDDKSSSDRSSEIAYTLEAGKTYYLQLRLYSTTTNAEGMIEIAKV